MADLLKLRSLKTDNLKNDKEIVCSFSLCHRHCIVSPELMSPELNPELNYIEPYGDYLMYSTQKPWKGDANAEPKPTEEP